MKKVILLTMSFFLTMVLYGPTGAFAAKVIKQSGKEIVAGTLLSKFPKVNAVNDPSKLSDMSDFDPNNPVVPTGDTIKIAICYTFSGPAAYGGQLVFAYGQWAAHDINKKGGILVDGKKKLIQLIPCDVNGTPDQARKNYERMVLQEKVHVLAGSNGSVMTKIMNEVANKYKVIAWNYISWSDDLQNAENFGRYSFMSIISTEQISRAMAYYYGQIRKKENKFYLLNQDYSFGYKMAEGFKAGLKEYFPGAQVVGEDYHKLFLTDFAPYLEKIKASGAEVIYTSDWRPDSENLITQTRQMGIDIPLANYYVDDPNTLSNIGVEKTKNLVQLSMYGTDSSFKTPAQIKYYTTWTNLWKNKWKNPYNTPSYKHLASNYGAYTEGIYWLLSAFERAKSTNPEAMIKVLEGDSYQYVNGKVLKMRACDHKAIQDLYIFEFATPGLQKQSYTIPPYNWFDNTSYWGKPHLIPAEKILPWMDQKLDRCKGKNNWGE